MQGSRATLTVNGQVVGIFEDVSISQNMDQTLQIHDITNYYRDYLLYYMCWDCGCGWNLSTADYCLECESKNIVEILS